MCLIQVGDSFKLRKLVHFSFGDFDSGHAANYLSQQSFSATRGELMQIRAFLESEADKICLVNTKYIKNTLPEQ